MPEKQASVCIENLKPWEKAVVQAIKKIPEGKLATYECIKEVANQRDGHNLIARNVAKLRGDLYKCYRKLHITGKYPIPLHRMAKQGDYCSRYDSPTTGAENFKLRKKEETPWDDSAWWDGS